MTRNEFLGITPYPDKEIWLGHIFAFNSSAEDIYGDSQIISVSERLKKTMETMEMPRQISPGSRTCYPIVGGHPAFADAPTCVC
jgi:hypothetical protein